MTDKLDKLHFADAEIDTSLDFAIRMDNLEEEYPYEHDYSCFLGYGGIKAQVFRDKNERYRNSLDAKENFDGI